MKEKPIVHTFSYDKCLFWRMRWQSAGFTPVVLPDGSKSASSLSRIESSHLLKRIQARANHPPLEGYLRWIATAAVAPHTQYVFMVQPSVFPGNMQKKALLTEAIARYVSNDQLVLLAGSDAVIGTKVAFHRMCHLLASDHEVTADNATDGFIVRRVMQQFPEFIIEIPSCKDQGEPGWEASSLFRCHDPNTLPAFDFQTQLMEATK